MALLQTVPHIDATCRNMVLFPTVPHIDATFRNMALFPTVPHIDATCRNMVPFPTVSEHHKERQTTIVPLKNLTFKTFNSASSTTEVAI